MTTATASSSELQPQRVEARFLRNRLASFLSIFPLGVWVVGHLWNNLAVFNGPAAWQHAVTEYPHPAALVVNFLVAVLPLLFHLGWGVARLLSTKPNNLAYNNYDNLKYVLQRLSAVGILLFVGAHVWLAFLYPRLVEGHAEVFGDFAHEMHQNLFSTLPVYVLGTLGVAYHLGNGVNNVAMAWGLAQSGQGLRRYDFLSLFVFAVVLAMAWGAIYGVYQAGGNP
jgi:succinate dehydrogenase / fumarate reductase cytochrome b subunit